MWQQIPPPDGYNGPCFRWGDGIAASKVSGDSVEWYALKRDEHGNLKLLPGVWRQGRGVPFQIQGWHIQHGLMWAEEEAQLDLPNDDWPPDLDLNRIASSYQT
jgi:hypothetical protein